MSNLVSDLHVRHLVCGPEVIPEEKSRVREGGWGQREADRRRVIKYLNVC